MEDALREWANNVRTLVTAAEIQSCESIDSIAKVLKQVCAAHSGTGEIFITLCREVMMQLQLATKYRDEEFQQCASRNPQYQVIPAAPDDLTDVRATME